MCRSPVAEAILRARLAERAVQGVTVSSAGLLEAGRAAPDDNVAVMDDLGYDLRDHRSRQVTDEMLGAADLIVTMAREHVREVVVQVPDVWPRTFTLRELVRRGDEVGPRAPGQPLDEWLSKMHAGRTPNQMLGLSAEDDVADPMGRNRRAYEQAADEIDALVDRMVDLVWGRQP